MRIFLYLLFIFLPLQATAQTKLATASISGEQDLLDLLDSYVDKRDAYSKQKEKKIDQLKLKLRTAEDIPQRLALLNSIYREYYTYHYDSAMVYVNRGLALSESENNAYYTTLNKINRAAVLSTGGFYSQSEELLEDIKKKGVPKQLKQYYYYTRTWLYNYWEAFSNKSEFMGYYHKKKFENLKLTMEVTSSKDVALHAYLSGELAFLINPMSKAVLQFYTKALLNSRVDSRVHASAAYCIARYYRELGDTQRYEKYIIEAAISDITCPLKENLALQEFSTYLYEKDQKYADHAARYI